MGLRAGVAALRGRRRLGCRGPGAAQERPAPPVGPPALGLQRRSRGLVPVPSRVPLPRPTHHSHRWRAEQRRTGQNNHSHIHRALVLQELLRSFLGGSCPLRPRLCSTRSSGYHYYYYSYYSSSATIIAIVLHSCGGQGALRVPALRPPPRRCARIAARGVAPRRGP